MAMADGAMRSISGSVAPLPYHLEATCPAALSHKPISGTPWPFSMSGPSSIPLESPAAFVQRHYLETLYLPEALMPIRDLQVDISRVGTLDLPAVIAPLLLSLKQLERRHRSALKLLVTAIINDMTSASLPEVKRVLLDEAIEQSTLGQEEVAIVKVAVEMRAGSRRIVEAGTGLDVRQLLSDLERREALIQTMLLFNIIPLHQNQPPKKRKKSKSRDAEHVDTAAGDPQAALATLMDRLSIWSALADMSLEPTTTVSVKGKEKESEGWTGTLRQFWADNVVPSFLPVQPDLCAIFHQKIFASPLPASYLPVPPPPPPAPARPSIPSRDQISRTSSLSVRSISRAGSETSDVSHAHSLSNAGAAAGGGGLHRSLSRTSDTLNPNGANGREEMRRSRSKSTDPARIDPPKRPLIRAPSGKDLFKGREVGLMRRTASRKSQESLGTKRDESQSLGLLGRKTSDPKKRRVSNDGGQRSQAEAGTIIFATPAKPRYGNPFSQRTMHHPTPIREEERSAERVRPAFVAETPSTNRVGRTPMTTSSHVAETPRGNRTNDDVAMSDTIDEDDNDDLGDLMVMTDEEDDGYESPDPLGLGSDSGSSSGVGLIPETPIR